MANVKGNKTHIDDNTKKYALALEGGGAKGAYHIGAVKALYECGYNFSVITGTSIGALNAIMIAQGDLDKAYDIWYNIKFSDIFDVEDEKIRSLMNAKISLDLVKYVSKKFTETIKSGGIDTTRIRAFIDNYVDEEKLRKSDIRVGLVTLCLSDRKGKELYIEDIPKGQLVDYMMASSNLPVFKRVTINNKKYVDGGFYDDCPVHMLEKEGYKDVIAIRTFKRNRIRDYKNIVKRNNINLTVIEPVDEVTNIMNFDYKASRELLEMGYYDTLKCIKKLDGNRYYITPKTEDYFFNKIININEKTCKKIISLLRINMNEEDNYIKVLLEDVIPELKLKLNEKMDNTYKDFVYRMVEYVALKENVKRYKIYEFDELLKEVKSKIRIKNKNVTEQAIYSFVKGF